MGSNDIGAKGSYVRFLPVKEDTNASRVLRSHEPPCKVIL